ncbi:MAG TPA: acyltransferase [Candidatus Cybelea sp.]|nr:acyltransferase [Candidatus Cybelea sp.]
MYRGIEGMRAWLAWSVVVGHITLWTGLGTRFPSLKPMLPGGNFAVLVFLIISGFVITNLIVEKRESYGVYLKRRFLRIYPAYLVALLLGVVAARLGYDALLQYPLTDQLQVVHFAAQLQEMRSHFLEHFAAHLLLIHGAIPNTVLSESQYAFVVQGWSLSLEWQFYLLAPLAVRGLSSRKWRFVVIALFVVAAVAYRFLLSGSFYSPSFLPGAGIYFLIGIGSRLVIDRLPKLRSFPYAFALGCLGLALIAKEMIPVAIWLCLMLYMKTASGASWALDSKVARWAGSRSYSVYLVHEPILMLASWMAIAQMHLGFVGTFLLVSAMTIGVTLLASEALYRYVEKPCIDFGKRKRSPKLGNQVESALQIAPGPASS